MRRLRLGDSPRRECVAALFGALLVTSLLVVVLSDRSPRLAATNSRVAASGIALTVPPESERCQGDEFVPARATRLRLYAGTQGRPTGPPLEVSIVDRSGRLTTRGQARGGYGPGPLVIRVEPRSRDLEQATFCLRNVGDTPVEFAGNLTALSLEAFAPGGALKPPSGEGIRVDYLRPGRESWLEIGPTVARRFQQFKPSFFGAWTMWAVLAGIVLLGGAATALQCRRSGLGEAGPSTPSDPFQPQPRGRKLLAGVRSRLLRWLPLAGWACAGIAVVNGALWASVIPPFQVPDEPFHVGYSQYLAETGGVPSLAVTKEHVSNYRTSDDYMAVLAALPISVEGKPTWSPERDRQLRLQLEQDPSRRRETAAGGAARYSPLYYALEAIPARAGRGLNALDRLYAMRLVPALLAGVTVAFVFLFLREVLPSTPGAWTLGALAVAFHPLFGFVSGGVNNDNLLWAGATAAIYLTARAFRRGLDARLGVGMGIAAAVATLAKPSMVGLFPGLGLALVLLVWRSPKPSRTKATVGALAAVCAGAVPTIGWLAFEAVVLNRPFSGTAGALTPGSLRIRTSLPAQLSYLWQFFLPRLPFMQDAFPRYPQYPLWDTYIQGFIGRFGWFQYGFPQWANVAGLTVLGAVATAAGVTLVRAGQAVKRRWPELLCYSTMVVGMVLLTGIAGYRYRAAIGVNFEQPRSLFPVLALYGGVVALAARAAGRRWGPSLAVLLVVLAWGHSLFAVLLTLGRYYT